MLQERKETLDWVWNVVATFIDKSKAEKHRDTLDNLGEETSKELPVNKE